MSWFVTNVPGADSVRSLTEMSTAADVDALHV